jgi:hypothetical protein
MATQKGYSNIREYIYDYKTYLHARKIDPGRDKETISSYLKNRISSRLKLATKSFRQSIKNKCYTEEDLRIIACHEFVQRAYNLTDFISQLEETGTFRKEYIAEIIKSRAFQSGKLPKLYRFIPLKISCKEDIRKFVRGMFRVEMEFLESVLRVLCKGSWKKWLSELESDKKIIFDGNMVSIL